MSGDTRSGVFQRVREPPTWFKVSFGATVLLAVMLLVMWAQQGPPVCTASLEAPRQLQLSRLADREHLAADSASATRTAHRYVASEAASAHREHRFLECEASLVLGTATTHGVSVDQVRASAGRAQ